MPLIRIPQTDVGEGPATVLPNPETAALPALSAAQLARQAGQAIVQSGEKIKARNDALLFTEENAQANQVWSQTIDTIESTLEQGVREQGWTEEEFAKQKKKLADELLAPYSRAFKSPHVKAAWEGRLAGFNEAPLGDIYQEYADLRNEDAITNTLRSAEDRIVSGGIDTVPEAFARLEEELGTLEEIWPGARERGDELRLRVVGMALAHYQSELGPVDGEFRFMNSLIQGDFQIPKRVLVPLRVQAQIRLPALAEAMAGEKIAGGGFNTDYIQSGAVPAPLSQNTDLDASISELEDNPYSLENNSALTTLKSARAVTLSQENLILRVRDSFDGGPPVDLTQAGAVKAMDTYLENGLVPMIASEGPEAVSQFLGAFVTTYGRLTPYLTRTIDSAPKTASPEMLVGLAEWYKSTFPDPVSGSQLTRSGGIVSPDSLSQDTHDFFLMLSSLYRPGDDPSAEVTKARELMLNRDRAKATMSEAQPKPDIPLTKEQAELKESADDIRKKELEKVGDFLISEFDLDENWDQAFTDQMLAYYRLEYQANLSDLHRTWGESASIGQIEERARQAAFVEVVRAYSPVNLFGPGGGTQFSGSLARLIEERDENGDGWTRETLGLAVLEDFVAAGIPEDVVRDKGFQRRVRLREMPNLPGVYNALVIPALGEKGPQGVLKDADGNPKQFNYNWNNSLEKYMRTVTGHDAMREMFREFDSPNNVGTLNKTDLGFIERFTQGIGVGIGGMQETQFAPDKMNSGEYREYLKSALTRLMISSGKEYLESREFLGFDPEMQGRRRDEARFTKQEIEEAERLINPETVYWQRSDALFNTYTSTMQQSLGVWEEKLGAARIQALISGSPPSERVLGYYGEGRDPKKVITEKSVVQEANRRAKLLMEERVRQEFAGKSLVEMFDAWRAGRLPSEMEK